MKLLIAVLIPMLFAGCGAAAKGQACGGFAGASCPTGQVCVDDPSDACNPDAGAFDCTGFCQAR